MRWMLLLMFWGLAFGLTAEAATSRVYKVLPQFLDEKGRSSLSPSLYDRDAYQASLRKNPAKISGMRFAVQWKATGLKTDRLKLRVEIRGAARGDLPKRTTLELPVQQRFWFSHWATLSLGGDEYKEVGEVTAWRVTLWDGDKLLSEQKSFLW